MVAMWKLVPPPPLTPFVPTPAQRAVLDVRPGVTLVVGGPGTGKTRALVEAVLTRVRAGIPLGEIAVLAGSRQAAQALRRDVVGRLGSAQTSPVFTTVHGLALGILRQQQPPDEEPWALLRGPQQEERIRDLLEGSSTPWPDGLRGALGTTGFARQLREVLARTRQRSLDEEDLRRLAAERGDATLASVADFLGEYLTIGDLEHTLDYAELVFRVRLLLRDDGPAASLVSQFRAIVVDDAHDLDPAQLALLTDIARLGVSTVAFADPSQLVSTFRGADAGALEGLLSVGPSRLVTLGESMRHCVEVGAALEALRRRLPRQPLEPELTFAAGAPGEVTVSVHDSWPAEVAHVADRLRRAAADGEQWSDMAVITRAGRAQLAPFASALARLGIPVEVAADELVVADDEVAAALLAALAVAATGVPPDDDTAAALLASPLGGLDALQLRRARRDAGELALFDWALGVEPGSRWEGVRALATALDGVAKSLTDGGAVGEALWSLWTSGGLPERLRQEALDGSRTAHRHLDAVVELFERAAREPVRRGRFGAQTFIRALEGEEIPADTGRESTLSGRGVQLTTAHRAKGREWARVCVVGVQEGRWPRATPGALLLDPGILLDGLPPTVAEHIQQERRLFALACSRARTHLHVSAVDGTDEQPSRFVSELGVDPQSVLGLPERPLTAPALVGELRRVLADEQAPTVARRGAALRLATLARRQVASASPDRWWGARQLEPPTRSDGQVRLSGSALADLLACPRQYYLRRRVGADADHGFAASFGTMLHRLAQEAQAEELDLEAMRARLDERWDTLEFAAPWQATAERRAADEVLERLARWLELHRDTLVGQEEAFEVPVTVGRHQVVLQGTVDRLDVVDTDDGPRLRVIDFKTTRKPPTAAELAGHVQLGLYQLAAAEGAFESLAPGVRAVEAPALLLLRIDQSGLPRVAEQSTLQARPTLGDEPLVVGPSWMHDRLAEAAELLERGDFPAIEGPQCRLCSFRASCPVWTEELS